MSHSKWQHYHCCLFCWIQKESKNKSCSQSPAQGTCKKRNTVHILGDRYCILPGTNSGSSTRKRNYKKLLQIYTGATEFYLLPLTVCLTVYLTPPPTSRLVCCQNNLSSIQCKLYCQYSKKEKNCISSLFSISLQVHSQCVGSSSNGVVDCKSWSRKCQSILPRRG